MKAVPTVCYPQGTTLSRVKLFCFKNMYSFSFGCLGVRSQMRDSALATGWGGGSSTVGCSKIKCTGVTNNVNDDQCSDPAIVNVIVTPLLCFSYS